MIITKEQGDSLYRRLKGKDDVFHTIYKFKVDFHVCSCGEPVRYCSSDKLVGHWNPNLTNPSYGELGWMINRVGRVVGDSSGIRFSNEERCINNYICSLVSKSLRYGTWSAIQSAEADSFPLALRDMLLKFTGVVKEVQDERTYNSQR